MQQKGLLSAAAIPASAVPAALWSSLIRLPLFLLFFTGQAAAAPDWHSCLEISDDQRRLACYDDYARKLMESGTETAAGKGPAAFGLLPATPAKQLDAMESRIVRVEKLAHGRRLIFLENGQIWKQLESRSQPRLAPGDLVRIRRAALGSFLLTKSGSKRALRVKRLDSRRR